MSAQCWIWLRYRRGGRTGSEYGAMKRPGTQRLDYVHRMCYRAVFGEIPSGTELHHLCGNTLCYKPSHLVPVPARFHKFAHARARQRRLNGRFS